jgi:Family of unknown function (DUF6510)
VSFVDGNQLAGGLAEMFAVDLTVARGQCANCGLVGMVAQARVFDELGPGPVARCPGCESVLLRMVRGRDRAWLDLRGLNYLEVPLTG